MGRVKRFIEEHGFYPNFSDIYVCSRCIDDYGLKAYIQENADNDECTYCGDWTDGKPIAIHINEFISYLVDCLEYEWGDPNDEGVGWDKGWVGATVIDTYDLLDELELQINHDELRDLLIDTLFDRAWCQKNPYSLALDDDLIFSWQQFSDQIKYKSRYVFFQLKTHDDVSDGSGNIEEPYQILEYLGRIVNEFYFFTDLPKGTEIYRVRVNSKKEFRTLKQLGPPDSKKAKFSNRMSPAGIPMFYGAFEKTTALKEIINPKRKEDLVISIATFKSLDNIKVLDLTKVPKTPSIFDEGMRENRLVISFLNSFLSDFTKPIRKDGREHIEYVPTQVATEFFRHIFLDYEDMPVQGIIYPSARNRGGKSCVLFFDQRNCTDKADDKDQFYKKWLFLDKKKTEHKIRKP